MRVPGHSTRRGSDSLLLVQEVLINDNVPVDDVGMTPWTSIMLSAAHEPVTNGEGNDKSQDHRRIVHLSCRS